MFGHFASAYRVAESSFFPFKNRNLGLMTIYAKNQSIRNACSKLIIVNVEGVDTRIFHISCRRKDSGPKI